jgi:2-dehydro-3-deoxygluconokinase
MTAKAPTGGVLTAGETMGLLDPHGDLAYGCSLTLRMAGAESNVAIALARLGVPVRWISRLGADPVGDVILETLAREGVDVGLVRREREAPTGLFYKARVAGTTEVRYYRAGSAASLLRAGDASDAALAGVDLVHLTGITMALSSSAREFVVDLARRARGRGLTVIFDPNWRPPLWDSPQAASAACAEVLPYADWVLCGAEEGALLFGADTPAATISAIRAAGAGDAVVRVGAGGAVVLVDGEPTTVPPERTVEVVDEIGAGDAFAAGFAFGLLRGREPAEAVRSAHRLAAAALEGSGDWETLPFLADLEPELEEQPLDVRARARDERPAIDLGA